MTGSGATPLKNLLAEAAAHYDAGRWPEADAAYRAALDLAPRKAPVMHNLGIVAAGAGDPTRAIEWFDRVIAAEPGYAAAHANRAVALLKLGRPHEAVASITSAVADGEWANMWRRSSTLGQLRFTSTATTPAGASVSMVAALA